MQEKLFTFGLKENILFIDSVNANKSSLFESEWYLRALREKCEVAHVKILIVIYYPCGKKDRQKSTNQVMDINDNINNDNKKSDLPWLQSANII